MKRIVRRRINLRGTSHAAIGAATGFIAANMVQSSPTETVLLVALGSISGLIPDLDIEGKLRGKITLSHKMIKLSAHIIGILMIVYSFMEQTASQRGFGIGFGLLIMAIASFIKQKHMLTLTGIAVLLGGVSLEEQWMILLGIYIGIASFSSHRTYTHSIIGAIFFSVIATEFESSIGINGIFYACIGGYVSHLLADMKVLPVNKRGVKLFLPLSSKEF